MTGKYYDNKKSSEIITDICQKSSSIWYVDSNNNLNIRIVHKWKQGDLVIPDMFVMYHALTGGFSSDEREFVGIWSLRDKKNIVEVQNDK